MYRLGFCADDRLPEFEDETRILPEVDDQIHILPTEEV